MRLTVLLNVLRVLQDVSLIHSFQNFKCLKEHMKWKFEVLSKLFLNAIFNNFERLKCVILFLCM